MAVNDFDFIAPFYDRLSKMVFGKSLIEAQSMHLNEIDSKDRVLILGGGTGKILEHIPNCERIDYVEKSKKMLKLAKKRMVNRHTDFIHSDFLDYTSDRKYDIIICPFFLDCFGERNLRSVLVKCKGMLKVNGSLFVTDFHPERAKRTLLMIMHWFFKATSGLDSKKLSNIPLAIINNGFIEKSMVFFKRGIFSAVYVQEEKK
ncbi:class I SAM-dependent methyltransferase [Ekhidna sp.]|uniref:class I SAM-dependent methyltransferase n=1 Tax=Ekhidna sp. TaxID=2608089 RepID=UPI0035186A74